MKPLSRVSLPFLLLALCVGLVPLVASGVEILVIGNSYTFYSGGNKSANVLQWCIEEEIPTWAEPQISTVTKGGYTLQKHANDATNASQGLYAQLSAPSAPAWDAVFLQEQSQTPGFFVVGDPLYQASLAGATVLDGLIQDLEGETWFLMTWGRRNGDSNNDWLYPDFLAMQDCLEQGTLNYQNVLSTTERPVFVAPAGRAWREIYLQHQALGEDPLAGESLFHRLYTGDGSHPSVLGSYITGLVMYSALTGRSPLEIQAAPDGVAEDDLQRMRQAAHSVILDAPLIPIDVEGTSVRPYPWVQLVEQETPPAEGAWLFATPDVRVTALVHAGPVSAPAIQVGTADPVNPADGRLLVQTGGILTSPIITVAGENSEFRIRGGAYVGSTIEGDLELESGDWEIPTPEATVGGALRQGATGRVIFTSSGSLLPHVQVEKEADLRGEWVLPAGYSTGTLVTAGTLLTEGFTLVDTTGEAIDWEVGTDGEWTTLMVTSGESPVVDTDTTEETDGTMESEEDTTTEADGETLEEPEDTSAEEPSETEAEDSAEDSAPSEEDAEPGEDTSPEAPDSEEQSRSSDGEETTTGDSDESADEPAPDSSSAEEEDTVSESEESESETAALATASTSDDGCQSRRNPPHTGWAILLLCLLGGRYLRGFSLHRTEETRHRSR